MGIYDRDYYREARSQSGFSGPRSVVTTLILINVALYLIDGLFFGDGHDLTLRLAVSNRTLSHPLFWWQFLSYGFVHSPSPGHIVFNMLQLWFLGREVEYRYGRSEFLRLYLVMIVIGGVAWAIGHQLVGLPEEPTILLGASGAVSGVVFLFVLNYPNRTLMLFPIPIPIQAWVIGLLLVVFNVVGAVSQQGNTAFGVHLAGLGFAYLYFANNWHLGNFLSRWSPHTWPRRGPRLKVRRPEEEEEPPESAEDPELAAEVDRILEKIHREGEGSLTGRERRILEEASRKYQQRRRQVDKR